MATHWMDMRNKTVIVTGGASGIGKSIVKQMLGLGASVYVLDLNAVQEEVGHEDSNYRDRLHFRQSDITNMEQVRQIVDGIAAKSTIDVLVNNAGIAHIGNLEQTNGNDMDTLYQVNIKGTYHCMHAVIPHMKNKGGAILNMASVAASVGISDRFAYSMTKGAVLAMTYSVAKDYIKYRIRCNSISPARVHTPFVDGFIKKNYPGQEREIFDRLSQTQPIGRMGLPAEVADLAVYLCSDKAGFITGTDFPIDGGFIKLNS